MVCCFKKIVDTVLASSIGFFFLFLKSLIVKVTLFVYCGVRTTYVPLKRKFVEVTCVDFVFQEHAYFYTLWAEYDGLSFGTAAFACHLQPSI